MYKPIKKFQIICGVALASVAIVMVYGDFIRRIDAKNDGKATQVEMAIELTRYVHSMADGMNNPRKGTLLYEEINGIRKQALCNDYASVLKRMIQELRIGRARILNVSFNPNGWDMHTLVEYFSEVQGKWIILDPTFAMVVKRKSDNMYATAEDVQQATLRLDWSGLKFILIDDRKYNYYLDYPLLFLNLHRGSASKETAANSLDAYVSKVSLPIVGHRGWYFLKYLGENVNDNKITLEVKIDGELSTLIFDGVNQTTKIFGANSIVIPHNEGNKIVAYKLKRFVFDG